MPWHDVRSGECISSLAERYGLVPERIWEHDENEALRELRGDGNILERGDRLFVPEAEGKTVERATDERHRFRRRGVPAKLTLRLVDDGHAHADRPFVARVAGREIAGTTDADGVIEVWVPPGAREVEVEVGTGDEADVFDVRIGQLDPVTALLGVQARLDNLGFDCPVDGEMNDETKEAIEDFQHYVGHESPNGELDDFTRDALAKLHDENQG